MIIETGQIWSRLVHRDQDTGDELHQLIRVEALCSRKTASGFDRFILIRCVRRNGQGFGNVEPVQITPDTHTFARYSLVTPRLAENISPLLPSITNAFVVPLELVLIALMRPQG